jgi:hypothetical protein
MKPLGILLVSVAVLLATQAVFAQRDAGAKIRGEYTFHGSAAGSAMRGARDTSSYYRQYAQSAPEKKVETTTAREAADTIGTYIAKAQKHMAWMRKQAQAGNDKETLTSLDSIDKHLAAAAKSHAEMHETCLKDNVDAAASMECCKTIDDHLAKAIAEHDKLMKKVAASKK